MVEIIQNSNEPALTFWDIWVKGGRGGRERNLAKGKKYTPTCESPGARRWSDVLIIFILKKKMK